VEPSEDDSGLESGDTQYSDSVRKRIQGKHRRMKAAEAEAAKAREEAEADSRFAEQQFNERKLAEARAEALEAENRELKAKTAPPKEPELVNPDENDPKYKDANGQFLWKQFSQDLARYEAKKAVQDEQKRVSEQRDSEAREAAQSRHRSRIDALSKQHPDYKGVFEAVSGTEADRQPQHVLNYLWESDRGEELRYYLAKNPVEAIRIAQMKPILGLAELGKLEDKLAKPSNTAEPTQVTEPPRAAAPPPPITPLSGEGTSGVNTDPAKMNFKELRAYERARSTKKH
jgi:hypothetical protein